MEIIFMRHGDAENKIGLVRDFDRKLTQRGIAAIERWMPELKVQVADTDHLHIWSSPAKRALQSAQILAQALDIEVETRDFIYDQSQQAFLDAIYELQDEDRIIVVGHQPSLSEWAEVISGMSYPFKKGDMIAFRKADKKDLRFRFHWRLP